MKTNFFTELLSNKDNVSSKRINGTFLIIVFVSILYVSVFKEISDTTKDLAETCLYGGLAFFAGTVIEKLKK